MYVLSEKEQSEYINQARVKPVLKKDYAVNTHNFLKPTQQKSRRLQFSVNSVS